MLFKGSTLPLKMVRPSIIRHITTAMRVEMLPMEKVRVDACVDRHENQEGDEESRLLVEMHPNLPEGYNCVLAPSVVDVAIRKWCQSVCLTCTVI